MVLSAWERGADDKWQIVTIRAAKVGTEGVESGVVYRLTTDSQFVKAEAA